jgi:hypothetical protein
MQAVERTVDALLALFRTGADWVLGVLAAIEQWLRGQLAAIGAPPGIQTAIMLVVALLLVLAALRVFGGLIRVLVVAFLILLALHAVLPLAHV